MGDAPDFQQNQPPDVQQMPQQQGYIAMPNANPYNVPYGNQPVGAVYKKICNPCCCCRRGVCNLRMNCIAIGIILIIGGLCQFYYIASPLLKAKDPCGEYGGYGSRSCGILKTIIEVMTALNGLMGCSSLIAGIFLLLAVFIPRQGWASLAAGILMCIISVMMFTNTVLFLVAINLFKRHIDGQYGASGLTEMIGTAIGGLLALALHIWLIVCAFQFWKQIKAGVDKYPAEGPPTQNIPPPTPMGYGPQPTLAPSSATLPQPPPPYNTL